VSGCRLTTPGSPAGAIATTRAPTPIKAAGAAGMPSTCALPPDGASRQPLGAGGMRAHSTRAGPVQPVVMLRWGRRPARRVRDGARKSPTTSTAEYIAPATACERTTAAAHSALGSDTTGRNKEIVLASARYPVSDSITSYSTAKPTARQQIWLQALQEYPARLQHIQRVPFQDRLQATRVYTLMYKPVCTAQLPVRPRFRGAGRHP
jgi:hypothetical protein